MLQSQGNEDCKAHSAMLKRPTRCTPCNCFIAQFDLWVFAQLLFFFFFLDDVNRAGALQYPHLGGGCENNHLELPVFLKHVAMGYRPEYPPPNGVHNNRFLPPRLLHTVHIQIHTRRAASRGGPGATTVPAAGVGDNQLRPASLEALPLPPVPRHLVAVTCKQGHLWALASPRAPLPSHDPRQ